MTINSELDRVAAVIHKNLPEGPVNKYDSTFTERLAQRSTSLTMDFWKVHFEWPIVKQYHQINGRILDFGCGSGHSDIFLAREGYTVHGIDMSGVGIAIAKDIASRESVDVQSSISFYVNDIITDIPDGELFDSAWSSHVFEHIENPIPILDGLQRWMKPDAYLLIAVPLGYAYNVPDHVHHYANIDEFAKSFGTYASRIEAYDISHQYQVMHILYRMPPATNNILKLKPRPVMYRYDIINHLIHKFGYKSYLEIGVASGGTIRAVQCETKDGVDSEKTAPEVNYHMTSDEFFKLHSDKRYDIVFIDGHHNAEYVCRDLNNALDRINENGIIVMHDCFPPEEVMSVKLQFRSTACWMGDGFKVVHSVIRNYANDLDCQIFDTDCGVGVIRRKHNNPIAISYDENYSWKEMFSNPEKTINLTSPDKLNEVV